MAIIVFVRHGENAWVKKHRLAGWIPGVHLNKKGHQQAAAAAERLAGLPVRAIYSSPVTRCVETAAYIADAHELPVHEIADLGEVRYGKWEGKKIKRLARKKSWHAVQHFPSRFRFPKGEALREVQFRAIQTVEQLNQQHASDVIVLVSHADLIKMVLAHYLGVHLDLFQRIVISPASVSIVALGKQGGVQIIRLNDTGPLTLPHPPGQQAKATSDEEE